MRKPLTIIEPGSRVVLENGIEGLLEQACLKHNGYVSYSVTYWSGSDRKESWFTPAEVKPKNAKEVRRIGFTA